jgi:hypothetical protein
VPDAGLTRLALADGTLTAAERDDPAAIASLLGTPEAVPEIRSYARASGDEKRTAAAATPRSGLADRQSHRGEVLCQRRFAGLSICS